MMTEVAELPQTRATPAQLAAALRDGYATTLRCVGDLGAGHWIGPYLPIVNPPLWETGHVAWFLESWVLRRPVRAEPFVANADALYDSSRVAHVARWHLPLPDPQATMSYLSRVTNAVLQRLESGAMRDPDELYYVELSLYHQDMHNEALRYTRQTLALSNPFAGTPDVPAGARQAAANEDMRIPAGRVRLGSRREDGWIFDNEKGAHEVDVPAFAIARLQTSNREFRGFVEDGGYRRRELWSAPGWRWVEEGNRRMPIYWRRRQGWEQRVYDRWVPLVPDWPVLHVNAYEAEAYCRWAGRCLPSEAEWERAAATAVGESGKRCYPWGDAPPAPGQANLGAGYLAPVDACAEGDSGWGLRQMAGNVWEWTSSVFEPFAGFSPDPYRDYSRPWFGTHRVLKGGCFATEARIARCAYRNFYTPDRADVFAGFRTCTVSG